EREELNSLYDLSDAYVSLHRAEGYGLTLLEAMRFGKPAIATAYGGNVDFMTEDNTYLVRSKMAEVRADWGPYKKGWAWAEPDLEHAAALMLDVYQNRAEAIRRGAAGRSDVLQNLGPAVVGGMMTERLARILAFTDSQD